MNLNFQIIGALFRHELRMILRDRRTIITAVLMPLIVTPLIFFASSYTRQQREATLKSTVYRYAVGTNRTEEVRSMVTNALQFAEAAAAARTNRAREFKCVEVAVTNGWEAVRSLHVQFLIEVDPSRLASNSMPDPGALPDLRFVYRADRDDSATGMSRMQDALEEWRSSRREQLFQARGFPISLNELAVVEKRDLASKAQVAGLTLGKMMTLFLVIFILGGGAVVANDLLAGEKERGTLETLLTSSANRADIIMAKQLVILAVALFITLTQALNVLVYVGFKVIPVSANLAAAVTPWTAGLLLLLFLPVAALISSALLLISGYSKSFKEAQLYFLPLLLVAIMPALAPVFPDLPLRSIVALVPIANIGIAAKEILVGSFDWPLILLAWTVTAGCAIWLMRVTISFLSAERLVTPATGSTDLAPTDGLGRFSRQVLPIFGILWALLWIVSSYLGRADVRIQVVVNMPVIFFGASLLMLWRYRLNWRETLSWRAPKPSVWLGVLCGIPGGILTASGLARWTSQFLPVPEEMLEKFSSTLLPEGITAAQLLLFLALVPGFFEEFTFRGLLLHGLRRRFRPLPTILIVGLIFGIFHFTLFRLAGTAFLGVLFAALTILTGSIFPAMVWHVGNNATGVLAELNGLPLADLDSWIYLVGVALLALAFWIFWRERRGCS